MCIATETTKKICCSKGEGAVDDHSVTKLFKKFHSSYKNLNNQAKSGGPYTMDSEILLQTMEANPFSLKLSHILLTELII